MSGFVALHRAAVDHPLFAGDSSRLGAWLWLVTKACWRPTKYDLNGKIITLDRGQFVASRSQLAKAWGWKESAVERFLTRLQTEQMIGRETGQGRSILTICNYAKYQDIEQEAGQETGQGIEQRSDSDRTAKEQGNKGTSLSLVANAPKDSSSGDDADGDQFQLEIEEDTPPDPQAVVIAKWTEAAQQCGWPIPRTISADRRKKLQSRIREHGVKGLAEAIARASQSNMLGRDPPRWWDFDFFVRSQDSVNKILEGKYDKQFGSKGANGAEPAGIGRTEAAAIAAMDDVERIYAAAGAGAGGRETGAGGYGFGVEVGDSGTILGSSDAVPDAMRRVGNARS